MLVLTEGLDVSIIGVVKHAAAGAGAGPLDGSKMILFTNEVAITPKTVLADLTQPLVGDYPAYAAQALTWGAASRNALGKIVTEATAIAWTIGSGDPPLTATGYGIVDGAGTTLLAAEVFEEPLQFLDSLSLKHVVARWSPATPEASTCSVF